METQSQDGDPEVVILLFLFSRENNSSTTGYVMLYFCTSVKFDDLSFMTAQVQSTAAPTYASASSVKANIAFFFKNALN